jgi:hypothetical protein
VDLSCGGLVLVGESAEDLFAADPVPGEVDLRWLGGSLGWRELAEGTVRPGGVVMSQVLGQHLAQVVLIDDQQPVEDLPAQGTVWAIRSATAGTPRILVPPPCGFGISTARTGGGK